MKLYLIGGLGADERVFKFLKLNCETQVMTWENPEPKESIRSYAGKLMDQICETEEFGILGVSFGGIVAIEIAKLCKPKMVILISSVSQSHQLPIKYILLGKTRILNLIPNSLIKPPKFTLKFLFGAKNTRLLKEIISDTNPTFIRWALNQIIEWKSGKNSISTVRIHGTSDRLIPLKGQAIEIEKGGHFMIVDMANEICKLVNETIKNAG